MAERDPERKVWMLPADLSDRIKAYQQANGIASEVEAARRLLDSALQMRDTVEDILNTLRARHGDEKDLRMLARDVLTNHVLVTEISFSDNELTFGLRNGDYGSLNKKGEMFRGEDPRSLYPYSPTPSRQPRAARSAWEAPKGGDLDDEIPF